MTELALDAGRLLPGLSGDRRARPAAAGRRDGRRRRRLGLPPRALRRPGAPADVPPARDRPHRRARGRCRPGATSWRERALGAARRASGLEVELDRRHRPVLRAQRAHARRQPARAGAEVRGRSPRSPAPSRRRVASFNYHQDHFACAYGLELADGAGAHTAASASARSGSRWRCSAPTASTRALARRGAARSSGSSERRRPRRLLGACSGSTRRATARIALHAPEPHLPGDQLLHRHLIELLHARGDEPLAAMG